MKIKAFTVLEMLINLALMAIILGLVYFVYTSFVQQVIAYQNTIEEQNNLTSYHLQLRKDFFDAEKVTQTQEGFQIIFYSGNTISYTITPKYILRKQQQRVDKLPVKKVKITPLAIANTTENLVLQLDIETVLYGTSIPFSIYKVYAPNIKLNL